MTVVVEKGTITAPAGTGQQTYNLGSAFNGILPRALILWATYETADADGKIDWPADPGCTDALDNDETDPSPPPPPGFGGFAFPE